MSGETCCKFCGAARDGRDRDFDHGSGTVTRFECESSRLNSLGGDKTWYESEVCKDGVLARFRAMFPTIMPDDPREITAEICDSMGMVPEYCGTNFTRWTCDTSEVSIRVSFNSQRQQLFRESGDPKTAGQLACLIAARRNMEAK